MRKALPGITEALELLKQRLQREYDGRKKPRLQMGVVKLTRPETITRHRGGRLPLARPYAAMAVPVTSRQIWNRCAIS